MVMKRGQFTQIDGIVNSTVYPYGCKDTVESGGYSDARESPPHTLIIYHLHNSFHLFNVSHNYVIRVDFEMDLRTLRYRGARPKGGGYPL